VSDSNWGTRPDFDLSPGLSPSRSRRHRRSELVSCVFELLLIVVLIVAWALSVG
jgi:hypothetical protein